MRPSLHNLRTTFSHWRESSYPLEELKWLEKDFKPLDSLTAGVCERIMQFVATGREEEVLETLAGMRAASGGLALRCRNNGDRATPDRARFFSHTTILEPAFHLRLALIYDAAAQYGRCASFGYLPVADGLVGGAEWLDAYLWELLREGTEDGRTSKLSALELEQVLELHGNPASWLVRAALVVDMTNLAWAYTSGRVVSRVKGFHDSLLRHPGMVRECLNQTEHRCKAHALEVLHQVQFSPEHCPDAAARLSVSTSKDVRRAAEAWISLNPSSVLPELKRIAVEGSPDERFHAVKLLVKIGEEDARAFLLGRVAEEKSRKVAELIAGILNPKSEVAAESGTATLPPLPLLPDAFADQSLPSSLIEDLRAVLAKANATWVARWEQQKAYIWAPKAPSQLPETIAEEWFTFLQTMDSETPSVHKIKFHPEDCLVEFAAHPKLKLVHVVRWAVILSRDLFGADRVWYGPSVRCFEVWMEKHGPIDFRQLADICHRLGFASDWIARLWFCASEYAGGSFVQQSGDVVWPYFAERLSLVEKALGWIPSDREFMGDYMAAIYRTNAWRALASFPTPPPSFLDRMWEAALGRSKTERALAQEALKRAPGRASRLIAALASGEQDQRMAAADWIGRLKLAEAIPALKAAIAKEKYDPPKAAMIGALMRMGVPPDEFLDRAALLKEAQKIVAKPLPDSLAWFPMQQLPVVHWSDNGAAVAPEIIQAWLVRAVKLKQAEPNALIRCYTAGFRADEREALGQFILGAWIAEDLRPHTRALAEGNAKAYAASLVQQAKQFPQFFQEYVGMTADQIYARVLPTCLATPSGSANDSKGVLAVAGACVGGTAAPLVADYLKTWYGMRVHQCRALLQMLAWVEHPVATQTLLAIGTRFRTKSLQQEASKLTHAIAERKGWSLAELADRTIPAAGFDDTGELQLDFGSRQFTARLDSQLNLILRDSHGVVIKTLPDPRKDDDDEKAAAAKKQLGTTRKELKQVLAQQRINFYEAMCVQRAWRFEDWELFLAHHPIVRHFCQRLVWSAQRGEESLNFRPLADGTYTDAADNQLVLEADDIITLTHSTMVAPEVAKAWLQHLGDYEIAPLFTQFGVCLPELTDEKKTKRELKDFEGWMTDTFKLRARATKLGYARGATGDGGWFNEYVKRFPTTGLVVSIEFTGSGLPEALIPAALMSLTFRRESNGQSSQNILISDIPAVLLAECWNDYRQIAAEGAGYDPEWEKKGRL